MRENKYFIPLNYQDGGTALNGMATKRNIVEGVLLALAGVFVVRLLPIHSDIKITVYVLVVGLGFMVGCIGVTGDPLSVFISDAFNWTKRRKPYIYNNHGEVFSTSAADLMLNQPQIRDSVADAIDKMRLSMAAKQIDYVEGETFQFAVDPELRALKAAEEKKQAQTDAHLSAEAAEQDKSAEVHEEQPEEPVANMTELDIAQVMDNIVLHDDDEGDQNYG